MLSKSAGRWHGRPLKMGICTSCVSRRRQSRATTSIQTFANNLGEFGVAVGFLDEAGIGALKHFGADILGGVAAHENDFEFRRFGHEPFGEFHAGNPFGHHHVGEEQIYFTRLPLPDGERGPRPVLCGGY